MNRTRFNPNFIWSNTLGQMTEQAQRLLRGLIEPTDPVLLSSYSVAGAPDATANEGTLIYVNNESGGKTLAFSDGTNWRRVQDRAIIS